MFSSTQAAAAGPRDRFTERRELVVRVGNSRDLPCLERRAPLRHRLVVVVGQVVRECLVDGAEQCLAFGIVQRVQSVGVHHDRTVDRAGIEVRRPPSGALDGPEGHVGMRRECDRLDDTAVECLAHFRCRHRGRDGADRLHRLADAARGPDGQSLVVLQRERRVADTGNVVLRQGRGHQERGVPPSNVRDDGGMLVKGPGNLHLLLERGHTQERKLQNRDGGVLVVVVSGAELSHLECADRYAVKVLTVFREAAVREIERECAVGFRTDELGQLFHVLGEGPALAPQRYVPLGGDRLTHQGKRKAADDRNLETCPLHDALPFFQSTPLTGSGDDSADIAQNL